MVELGVLDARGTAYYSLYLRVVKVCVASGAVQDAQMVTDEMRRVARGTPCRRRRTRRAAGPGILN